MRNLSVGMKLGVLINQHIAGRCAASIVPQLRSAFAEHGIETKIIVVPGSHLAACAEELIAAKVDGLVAGGGDGTVSTIAEVSVRHRIPLGVLPLGTRNHFGRDLGLPTQSRESIGCIAAAHIRRVDIGTVNGRIFVNNSSIGAYPRAVELREALRDRFQLRKHVAGVIATLRIFAQRPVINAKVELDGTVHQRTSPFVFVGNNVYTIRLFSEQFRSSLTEGRICIYTARPNGVSGLFHLLWLSLWNRLDQAPDFDVRCGVQAIIRLPQSQVRVSRDGEVSRMRTPLHYAIQPAALEVFAPAQSSS